MAEIEARVNTLLFNIDKDGPKVSALSFQRFLRDDLGCSVNNVRGIQQEFGTRRVYVKFDSAVTTVTIMKTTHGSTEIKSEDGTATKVEISHCGFVYKEVRVFNVPFEVSDDAVANALGPYGKVISIKASTYGKRFIFRCDRGVRVVQMELRKHVPSFLCIGAGRARATVVYDGQERRDVNGGVKKA